MLEFRSTLFEVKRIFEVLGVFLCFYKEEGGPRSSKRVERGLIEIWLKEG